MISWGDLISSASAFLAITAAIGGGYYLWRFVGAQDVRAQLSAKDSAIATQGQVSVAQERRIEQLENDVAELRAANAELRAKLEHVEQYSAPVAVERFEAAQERFVAQQDVIIQILKNMEQNQRTRG